MNYSTQRFFYSPSSIQMATQRAKFRKIITVETKSEKYNKNGTDVWILFAAGAIKSNGSNKKHGRLTAGRFQVVYLIHT